MGLEQACYLALPRRHSAREPLQFGNGRPVLIESVGAGIDGDLVRGYRLRGIALQDVPLPDVELGFATLVLPFVAASGVAVGGESACQDRARRRRRAISCPPIGRHSPQAWISFLRPMAATLQSGP